jgi:tRNA threonylcarbamoyl adenosine modification protein (Sua5/YciO/YrdC/YwlC family)
MSVIMSLKTGRAKAIARAADAAAAGRLVVFPTDTIYGVGADAFQPLATAGLFAAKGRPRSLALPVMVIAPRQAWALCSHVPDEAAALAAAFWPGALTVVLRQAEGLPWDLGEARGTVALRIPSNADARDLIARVGPMAVTSANRTGEPTPRGVRDVAAVLGEAVDVYLDGGPSGSSVPSTIVDLSSGRPIVRREGAIAKQEIERVMGVPAAGP